MTTNYQNSTKNAKNNSEDVENKTINQNTPENIDWSGTLWRERTVSHPERTITIGTSCSGIGAPEEARIVSADGISPTLTFTHCDFYIWIPPRMARVYSEKCAK